LECPRKFGPLLVPLGNQWKNFGEPMPKKRPKEPLGGQEEGFKLRRLINLETSQGTKGGKKNFRQGSWLNNQGKRPGSSQEGS